jgi:hypothetical protein
VDGVLPVDTDAALGQIMHLNICQGEEGQGFGWSATDPRVATDAVKQRWARSRCSTQIACQGEEELGFPMMCNKYRSLKKKFFTCAETSSITA